MDKRTDEMHKVARALARAFLQGDSHPDALLLRAQIALGRKWPWLGRLAREIALEFGPALHAGQHDSMVRKILDSPPFLRAFHASGNAPRVRHYFTLHPSMGSPPKPLSAVSLPALHTPGDLAEWLGISSNELEWFANIDGRDHGHTHAKLCHYNYSWKQKRSGGMRLIEAPKSRLRSIQRKILHEILDRIPTHPAAHGCVRGRSAVSNSVPHIGHSMVLRLDLSDFFTSIRASRIHALFQTLGYAAETARYLTGLTTHHTPRAVLRTLPIERNTLAEVRQTFTRDCQKWLERHLPQGAPTSPALANLCAYRLDLRFAGVAREIQGHYSRYVDDLTISFDSGSKARGDRIALMAYGIVMEEGFSPNIRKTRLMPRSRSQIVTGLVVNRKVNVRRDYSDLMKAILTNCIRHGPESQNRHAVPDFKAHLLGKLSYIRQVNPVRGEKLMALFSQIEWPKY